MAAKPLTTEAIALTEKKMDMTLGMSLAVHFSQYFLVFFIWFIDFFFFLIWIYVDDIIKMSKNTASTKAKQQRRPPVRN